MLHCQRMELISQGEPIFCAMHIINQILAKDVCHMNPVEKWYGYDPSIHISKYLNNVHGSYSQIKEKIIATYKSTLCLGGLQ